MFNIPKIAEAINKSFNLLNTIPVNIKLATPSDNELINQRITTFLNKTPPLLKSKIKNYQSNYQPKAQVK